MKREQVMRINRRFSTAVLGVAAMLLLAGCGRLADCVRVAEGNRMSARGDYQGAMAAYLAARRQASGEAAAAIDYDLANVYARLGEYAASAELYAAARKDGRGGVVADSFFNEGVALFERGRYEDSWKAFRQALRLLDPASGAAADARRDLELAWRAWKKSGQVQSKSGLASSSRAQGAEDEGEQKLLRRLETGRWRPGSAPPSAPSASDY
jgi:tetratricopeptide (TPR) repeat protein